MARKTTHRKQAVAIKGLERDKVSGTLAARGSGRLAEKIIALAKEHGIPVKEDEDMVGLLAKLDLEQALPPELYSLVAELLGFAYSMNQAAGQEEVAQSAADETSGATAQKTAAALAGEKHVSVEPGEATLDELPKPRALPDRSQKK
ncbi:MAG: EscU/YscU/HrcU family type III secretion system export apparatus switch protein [Candidatus Sumerlaeota bacterium]|nr:EscU/YscU/HrcU family type III secretion system export apparatus switch protein [Candidatus Sumerlaeota bacterium]